MLIAKDQTEAVSLRNVGYKKINKNRRSVKVQRAPVALQSRGTMSCLISVFASYYKTSAMHNRVLKLPSIYSIYSQWRECCINPLFTPILSR